MASCASCTQARERIHCKYCIGLIQFVNINLAACDSSFTLATTEVTIEDGKGSLDRLVYNKYWKPRLVRC